MGLLEGLGLVCQGYYFDIFLSWFSFPVFDWFVLNNKKNECAALPCLAQFDRFY